MAVITFAASVPSGLADRLTGEVLSGLEATLQRLAASSDGWLALLNQAFDARTAGSQEQFSGSAERLRQDLDTGSFSIRLELRSGQELQGGYAAYAAGEAGFGERIVLNADWAATASVADLQQVLLEELGHAFDQRLNGGADSAGDEGELFAARVLGTPLDAAALARIREENDGGTLLLDGQAAAVEFSGYNAATTDTDGDGVFDAVDFDDDNDGILDTDEQLVANSLPLTPNSLKFNYAQNTFGYQSFHNGAFEYQKGGRNDPAFLFDRNVATELRVHSDDVYEFGFLTATGTARTISAGSSFTLTEGSGSNDAKIAVLASTDSTDPTGNTNNGSGGGQGWATIRSRFNGIVVGGSARTVNTVADLEALFLANGSQPLTSLDGKSILLYVGASDSTRSFTTTIPVSHVQLVGLVKHGGWAELSLSAEVNPSLDTDGDGIPDSRDLDSDNDGISDLYESLGSKPSALAVAVDNAGVRDGTITLADITAYNTANPTKAISTTLSTSGVWQFLGDPALANDGSKPIDSDGDGVRDVVDLDSDGDGIPDTIEARPSSGYNVNDGDVIAEDSDGDGVIDRFDTKTGFGGSFTTPVNTDDTPGLGGDGTTTTNAGSATKVVVDKKVDSEANALGAFDGKFAKLNDSKDQLVLDLGSDVPVGTTITIRAKKDDSDAANKLTINQSSLDGTTLTNTQSSAFTTKDVLQDITYTTTGAAGSTTRYVSLKFDRKKGNLFVDGLTWQWGSSVPGYAPDYLDLNSDNDSADDATESGLTRTGVDANNDGIDDGIGASYKDPDGSINAPLGSTGLKNNDAQSGDVDYRSLNTAGVNITDVTVNESSPWAVFTLSGPTSNTTVKLSLVSDTDPDTANATIDGNGTVSPDLAASPPATGTTTSTELQWFNGSAWVGYVPDTGVVIPANGSRLVRVKIKNDSPAAFEGPETFRLQATYGTNSVSQGGLGTIVDDGTGGWWKDGTNSATSDTSGVTLDNDTPIDITDVDVNEASPYAVFDLTGNAGQQLILTLGNDTDPQTTNATIGTDTGVVAADGKNNATIQYYDGSWKNYTVGNTVTLDANGELLVRVAITNDGASEGPETFLLRATVNSNGITSTGGLGTIYDDGTGDVFLASNTTATPNVSTDAGYPTLDDDRPIVVTDVAVNEASPYAIFDIEGNGGQVIRLSLASDSATAGSDFNGTMLQYLNASNVWTDYASGSATNLTLPASGELLVRVRITQDAVFENLETFKLNVTNTANNAVSAGTASIIDDGTGAIYPDNITGATDNSTSKDDDRVLSVTSFTLTESSPYAVFTVTATVGQKVALALANGTATNGNDFGPGLEIYNGSSWTPYTAGSSITVGTGGSLLVRTAITNDTVYEGSEAFTLAATYTSGGARTASGTATIRDDGTSNLEFLGSNTTGTATTGSFNNDKPTLSVSNVTVSESSPYAVVAVSLSNPSASAITFTPALISGTALAGTDTGAAIEYFNGSIWVSAASGVSLAAGATSVLLRTAIVNDLLYEGPESLQITTGTIGGTVTNSGAATGTITITDDNTSGNRFETNTNSATPIVGTPDDDRPTIEVSSVTVSEASPYAVLEVSLDKASALPLSFTPALVNGSATNGSDFGSDLQYLNPTNNTWTTFSGGQLVIPAGSTSLLLRTAITNDSLYEVSETFQITTGTVTGVSNGAGAAGTVTIKDDGTSGNVFLSDNKTKTPTSGTADSDKRDVSVTGGTFNEASKYAIFTVTNTEGSPVNLSVRDAAANVLGPSSAQPEILYSTDGGATWTTYTYNGTTGSRPVAPNGTDANNTREVTSFLVAVNITREADASYEGAETFFLDAADANDTDQASGAATLIDDGTGPIVQLTPGGLPVASGNVFTPDTTTPKDDDRVLSVSSPTVSESSPFALFTVLATPGQSVSLALTAGSATVGDDYGPALQVYNGSAWVAYTPGASLTIGGDGKLLVRTAIAPDSTYEGLETFGLSATYTSGGSRSASGTATITDDGSSANVFLADNTTGTPTDGSADNDKPTLSVSSVTVSESSPYAVVAVSLSNPSATDITFTPSLVNGTALKADGTITLDGVDDFGPALQVLDTADITDGPGGTWKDVTASLTIPAGSTSLLLRTAIVNDTTYEGPESFQISTGTISGPVKNTGAAAGTITIADDGSSAKEFLVGNTTADPTDGSANNDTPTLSVSNVTVSESSPYAVVTVSLSNPSATAITFTPALISGTATAGTDTGNTPSGAAIEYFNGSTWESAAGGVSLAAGATSLLLRTAIVNDTTYEGPESLQISTGPITGTVTNTGAATGTVTIADDGSSAKEFLVGNNTADPTDGSANNDTPTLSVSSVTVSESSPYAVVTVSLSNPSATAITFTPELINGTATAGTDTDTGTTAQLQYFNGSTWESAAGGVTLAANTTSVLLRTAIVNDGIFEGPESLQISTGPITGTVKNTGAAAGTITIADDGSSNQEFLEGNTSATPTDGSADNDKPTLSVSSVTVSESSPYAVLTVSLSNPSATDITFTPGLISGTGVGGALVGTDTGAAIEYFNGSAWVSAASGVSLAAGATSVLLRTAITDDALHEGPETFQISTGAVTAGTVTNPSGAAGTVTITDNNTSGNRFEVDTNSATPIVGTPDDDRPTIEVSSVTVSEASPYAVLQVSLSKASGLPVSFTPSLLNDSATSGSDFGPALQYLDPTGGDGGTWTNVTGPLTIPAGSTTLLLRTAITNDVLYEISETFQITTGTVTGVSNGAGAAGTVTIKDDGSANTTVFNETNKTTTPDSIGPADNDKRDVSVTGGTFNESSKWAVFTVTNTEGAPVNLSVRDATANVLGAGGAQPEIRYSTDGGTTWTTYTWNGTTGNRPVAPSGTNSSVNNEVTSFLVAVDISREADAVYEGSELFYLDAADANDTDQASGAATLVDDGTGSLVKLDGNGNPVVSNNAFVEDTTTAKDDDRSVTVSGKPDVSEGTNAIFTVTLAGNVSGTTVSLVLGQAGDTALSGDYSPLTGTTAYYFDAGDIKRSLSIDGSGAVTLPAGVGAFFVSVPTTADAVYEGAEAFTLQATAFGGAKSGSGSSTILDGGTGKRYDEKGIEQPTTVENPFTADDDRSVTVSGKPDVSEGSNAIFTVTLSGNPVGTEVTLSLSNGTAVSGSDYSALSGATAYYFDGSNTKQSLTINGSGAVTLPSGVTSFFVSVPTTADAVYEGAEAFTLSATAFGTKSGSNTTTIVDDGTGKVYDDKGDPAAGIPDDDRSVTVSTVPAVSEGSNAVFTISLSGNPGGTPASVILGGGSDTAGPNDYSPLTGATAYYFDGGNVKQSLAIDVNGVVTLPGGVQLFYVSLPTTADAVYEGPESFILTATAFDGAKSGSGSATIRDDGTGKRYDDKGAEQPATEQNPFTPDDDRTVTVTGKPDVSEGTNAVFNVTLGGNPAGMAVNLSLGASGDTAGLSDFNPLSGATAYYFVGTVKTILPITAGQVALPAGVTSFFVSVRTIQDGAYEGSEFFTLTATAFGGVKSGSDRSTILDNGSGKAYDDRGVPIPGTTPDDDRTVSVLAYGPVNEASTYAMFTVTAIAGQSLDLSLQNGSSGTAATWAGFTPLEFSLNGTTWTAYSEASKPTVPGEGKVYVRATITSEQDANYEGAETFALKAAYSTNPARSATADVTIVDDGSGLKYGPNFDVPVGGPGVPQQSGTDLDADTGLTVSSITVNEASPFAVFSVTGAAGLPVSLQLANGTTGGLSGLAYSLDNGATWTPYTSGTVALPGSGASGTLLVRTALTPEQDALFENRETFTLTATPTTGSPVTGTATITDDGTGTVFNPNGTANTTAVRDDDRVLAVNSITVNEGSPFAVFTLTANVGQTLSLGFSNGIQNTSAGQGDGSPADGSEDYDPTVLQIWDPTAAAGNGAWVAYSGAFTVPGTGTGSTSVLARVKINPDLVFEGPEDFRLTATTTSGASRSATGVATIVDNGTGLRFPDAAPAAGPTPVTDNTNLDDDRILIAVSSATVTESAGIAEVTVSLSKAAAGTISFTPFLTARSATLSSDFGPGLEVSRDNGTSWTALSGALTFAPGETSLKLRTPIVNDSMFEITEVFDINTGVISSGLVANPSGAIGTVTITDDDVQTLGSLAVSVVSTGNEAGPIPNIFRITRTASDISADLVVPFTIPTGARFGVDYSDPTTTGVSFAPATASGTITIKANQTSADLLIPTVDNAVVDGTRALTVGLQPPAGYTVTSGSAQGLILDNDIAQTPPELSIGKGNVVEPDLGQTRLVNLSVQLSKPSTEDITVVYDVIPATAADVNGRLGFDGQPLGLATPNVDYTPITGTIIFRPGLTSTLIQVPVIGDNIDENDEAFYVRIVSAVGSRTGAAAVSLSNGANRGEIIIIDNENTSGLNIDYSTSLVAIDIRGGTGNDVITGTRFDDTIYTYEGNDYLRGGLGADLLTGGIGADIFAYTDLPESTSTGMDRIRDFAPGGGLSTGDRLQFSGQAALVLQSATNSAGVNGLPSALFNASRATPIVDFNTALQAAFTDKDLSRSGNQVLGTGEAVIFNQGAGRTGISSYLVVNIGTAAYQPGTDFIVNITGWTSTGFASGQLAVSDFFQSAIV